MLYICLNQKVAGSLKIFFHYNAAVSPHFYMN